MSSECNNLFAILTAIAPEHDEDSILKESIFDKPSFSEIIVDRFS